MLSLWSTLSHVKHDRERDYPFHPDGKYAFVTPGSKVKLPDDVLPIELHSNKAKMLARVELKSDLVIYRYNGCEECSGVGYSGRLAIHEFLENSLEIKNLIKKRESSETINDVAMKSGMATLNQDGILKVLNGLTDMHEIRRVCIR